MDVEGGNVQLGVPVQIWGCDNNLKNQKWNLETGITIRPLWGLEFCLDLAGQKPDKGAHIQLWRCNGLRNQKWVFDNFQIKPIDDLSKCIDAGDGHKGGNGLYIWDCNGQDQQIFGYDL